MMRLKHSKEFTFSKSLLLNRASALLVDLLSATFCFGKKLLILKYFYFLWNNCGKARCVNNSRSETKPKVLYHAEGIDE